MDKRNFLKIGGCALLGATAAPALRAFGQHEAPAHGEARPSAGTGPRWAMVINTKACPENCRDCIDTCHNSHNVPDFVTNPDPGVNNPRHEIKWIWHEGFKHAFPGMEDEHSGGLAHAKPLVLCNHCDNPPCVRVCPTKATFKRKDGIVMMDYHRCIGCRFCIAACPFGARSFNYRDPRQAFMKDGKFSPPQSDYPTRMQGVVEKCTFCVERLAVGKPPACVEACKHGGLIFGDIMDPESPVRKALAGNFSIRRKSELGTLPQVYYLV